MDNELTTGYHQGHGCQGGCCGSHGAKMTQTLVQEKIVDKVQEQKQLTFYTFDTYGMLFGETERALAICKIRAGQQPLNRIFQANVTNHDLEDMQLMMMNIEGFCQALFGFDVYARNQNLQKVKIPHNPNLWEIFESWALAINNLPDDQAEISASKRILKYVVESLIKNAEVSELPDELQEIILRKAERDKIAQEYVEKKQFDIISMVTATQNLSDKAKYKVEQLSQSNQIPQISTQPIIQIAPEDLNFRRQDDSHMEHYQGYNPEYQNQPPYKGY